MKRLTGGAGILLVVALSVAFGGLLAGMLIMLVAGIHSDLKVRRILRDRLAQEGLQDQGRFVDQSQQELFEGGAPPP